MDLTTLRLEVRERLGELAADFFSDAEVDRALNDAQKRFNSEERWPWLVTEGSGTILAGDDSYNLPDNVQVNRTFNLTIMLPGGQTITTYPPLERVQPEQGFRLRQTWRNRQSRPLYYYLTAVATDVDVDTRYVATVRLVPEADQNYDLEFQYFRQSTDLSGANDNPDMPEEYHDAVPSWAAGKLFLKEIGISAKSTEQFTLYENVLDQARRDVETSTTDETIAWGRDPQQERVFHSRRDWIYSRIPQQLG